MVYVNFATWALVQRSKSLKQESSMYQAFSNEHLRHFFFQQAFPSYFTKIHFWSNTWLVLQSPPCCSFARHLVEKCSSNAHVLSTAQTKKNYSSLTASLYHTPPQLKEQGLWFSKYATSADKSSSSTPTRSFSKLFLFWDFAMAWGQADDLFQLFFFEKSVLMRDFSMWKDKQL